MGPVETYWGLGSEIEPSVGILLLLVAFAAAGATVRRGGTLARRFRVLLTPWLILLMGCRLVFPLTLEVAIVLIALLVAAALVALSRTPDGGISPRMERFAILYGLLFLLLAFGFARNQDKVQVRTMQVSASSGTGGSRNVEGSPSVQRTIQRADLLHWRPVETFVVQSTPEGARFAFTSRDWYVGPTGLISGHDLADRIALVNGVSIVDR